MCIELRKNRIIFIIMVRTVSFFIIFYSTYYMERYNKKKFLILTIIFFFSMVILSISRGFTTTMLGWDGLGISSICLIMIYQRKKTSRNSLLTITFNRIGDVLLILGLIKTADFNCDITFTINENISTRSLIFIALASITKSAQFPLST